MNDFRYIENEKIKLKNPETVPYVSFNFFEAEQELSAGFSTRMGGVSEDFLESLNLGFGRGDRDENVRENFRRLSESAGFDVKKVVLPNQQHTTNVRTVTHKEFGSGLFSPKAAEAVDGQVTNVPGAVLITYGADCVPVYLYDPSAHCVGLCHSGWKGALNNIPGLTVKRMMEEYGSRPENILAVIGPSICMDCYEVGSDVADRFIERFRTDADGLGKVIRPQADTDSRNSAVHRAVTENPVPVQQKKYYLDLWQVNRLNLLSAGLTGEHIEISGVCTKCNHDLFFSHRFHGDARGVNAGFIFLRE